MVMASSAMLHSLAHANDQDAKDEIWKAVGDISGIRVVGTQVLLGVYMRPAKTKSGLILTHQTQVEDVYQGWESLVLSISPDVDASTLPFKVGDWVAIRPVDAVNVSVKGPGGEIGRERTESQWQEKSGWPCRIAYTKDIYMVLQTVGLIA